MEKHDVIIIGGGLAGLSAAYFLTKVGKKCLVLEAEKVGSGATTKTTAFLTSLLDSSAKELVTIFGKDKAKLSFQSHQEAISVVENLIQQENIDCSFARCPSFFYALEERGLKELQEQKEIMKEFGFEVQLLDTTSLPFKNAGVMKLGNQGKFIVDKFLEGLRKASEKKGAHIQENAKVTDINIMKDRVVVTTENGQEFLADNVVIATYYPFSQKKTHFKKGMYKSYVMELEVKKGSLPEAIYEDTENPYNYFRIDPKDDQYDSMIIGGQDHRMELGLKEEEKFQALEDYVKKTFPTLEYKVANKWTGPILEPSDGLALIGKISDREYVVTAFSGNGMTYSMIAGQLLADLMNDKENPYKELYDPKRLLNVSSMVIKGRDYFEENFNTLFRG